ncbi:hypothetical protein Ancab_012731 [Ancistrocladus abbreviatus]
MNINHTYPGVSFHALSGFLVVYNMLNLTAKANLTKIWEKGQHLCSRSWGDFSNVSGNQYLGGQYCFMVFYVASVIEDALCLGNAEITFGPGDVSWTLGASFVNDERLWMRASEAHTSSSTLAYLELMSSPIWLFVFLLLLLFIVYNCQVKLPMP